MSMIYVSKREDPNRPQVVMMVFAVGSQRWRRKAVETVGAAGLEGKVLNIEYLILSWVGR